MRGASLLWFLFSSGGIVLTLLAALLWCYARPKSRAPRLALTLLLVGYALVSLYPIPHAVEQWTSAPFHPLTAADVPAGRSIVVLLGSGSYRRIDWSGAKTSTLDPIGTERTLEAARAFRLVQPEFIISSGGLVEPDRPEDPAGEIMADTLVRLGVPRERIIIERTSTNTRDEALNVAAILPSLNVQHVILVTSAIHMRRSVGMFRAAGVEVIPAVARQPEYSGIDLYILPSDTGLRTSAMAVHELAGLTYYLLKGWYK